MGQCHATPDATLLVKLCAVALMLYSRLLYCAKAAGREEVERMRHERAGHADAAVHAAARRDSYRAQCAKICAARSELLNQLRPLLAPHAALL